MNDMYNIMSHQYHQHEPAVISGNLEDSTPIIFPALIDYEHVNPIFLNHLSSPLEYYDDDLHHDFQHNNDHVNPIFLNHLPSPLECYDDDLHHDFQHNNDHVDQRITAAVVGDVAHDLSFWSGDDDHEKGSAGTLESLVDQATRLVPTGPVSAITYYGGNIKMINDDDMISTCFGYNPQQIITTMAVSDILGLTNDTHGLAIEHRSNKEKEEEIYAVNNKAVEMDNYVEAVEIEHRRTQREGSKKTEKCNSTSSINQRSKATILHNKSERKRRHKINQRMEALKRLVPNIWHKTDKATILDQVIEYIRKLHNERDQLMMMMSSLGMNNDMTFPRMIPMSYYMYMQQQQHQMSMMADGAQMGMGVDLGSMHTNPIMHPNMRY